MELYKNKIMKSAASFTGCFDHRYSVVYSFPRFWGLFLHSFSPAYLVFCPEMDKNHMLMFACLFSILSVCSLKYSLKCGLENTERNCNLHLKTEFQTNLS